MICSGSNYVLVSCWKSVDWKLGDSKLQCLSFSDFDTKFDWYFPLLETPSAVNCSTKLSYRLIDSQSFGKYLLFHFLMYLLWDPWFFLSELLVLLYQNDFTPSIICLLIFGLYCFYNCVQDRLMTRVVSVYYCSS